MNFIAISGTKRGVRRFAPFQRMWHAIDQMTLNQRRWILNILLFTAFSASAFAAYTWYTLFSEGLRSIILEINTTVIWWNHSRPVELNDPLWALAGLSFLCIFPLLAELVMRRGFGRSPSPEVFFLRIFLLTLPLQAFRLTLLFVHLGDLDIAWATAGLRVSWFARFIGIVAVLNIGLYGQEIPFRRSGAILGMGFLASLAVAVMLPLDFSQITGNLAVMTGAGNALTLAIIAMEVLAVVSLIGSAFAQRVPKNAFLALSLLAVIAGWDLATFTSRPLLLLGSILLVVGTIAFSRQIRRIYQWL